MTVRNERFYKYDGDLREVIAEIDVDTAEELPEVDGLRGRKLHQGSTAVIITEGKLVIFAENGHWHDVNGEEVK